MICTEILFVNSLINNKITSFGVGIGVKIGIGIWHGDTFSSQMMPNFSWLLIEMIETIEMIEINRTLFSINYSNGITFLKKNDSFRGQQRSLIISWLYCDVFQIFHFGDIKPIEKIIYYGAKKWFWFHRKTARVCFTDRQISISLQLTQAYDKYLIKETWRIEKIWNANSFLRLNFFEKPAFLSFHT